MVGERQRGSISSSGRSASATAVFRALPRCSSLLEEAAQVVAAGLPAARRDDVDVTDRVFEAQEAGIGGGIGWGTTAAEEERKNRPLCAEAAFDTLSRTVRVAVELYRGSHREAWEPKVNQRQLVLFLFFFFFPLVKLCF